MIAVGLVYSSHWALIGCLIKFDDIMLAGMCGMKTLQTFEFSVQLPLAGKIWQCVTSLNVDQGPAHFQERLLAWLCNGVIGFDKVPTIFPTRDHDCLHRQVTSEMEFWNTKGNWKKKNITCYFSCWFHQWDRAIWDLCANTSGDGQLVFVHSGFFLTLCSAFSESGAVAAWSIFWFWVNQFCFWKTKCPAKPVGSWP